MHSLGFVHCVVLLSFLLCFLQGVNGWRSPRKDEDEDAKNWFHFMTRPDIQAPKFVLQVYDRSALAPGYWFFAPYQNIDQLTRGDPWVGSYIYDDSGELVWAGTPTLDHFKSFDVKVSKVNGSDMLSVIFPHDNAGLIFDNHYQLVDRVVYSPNKNMSNMHDFFLKDDGHKALVMTKQMGAKLSKEKSMQEVGFDGNCKVRGDGFKELDITTTPPKVVFEWVGTDHIGLDETTYLPHPVDHMCEGNWDIHHFNAVDKFPDGDYLISSRHTSTVYKISHTDGSIVWRLGGVKSDFVMDSESYFQRQHHARVRGQTDNTITISMFDNVVGTGRNEHPSRKFSRGLVLSLDLASKRATVAVSVDHPAMGRTSSRGSNQILRDGNLFVCWAYHGRISEHAPDGRLLMHAYLKKNIHTYRAYKFPWVGQPLEPPTVYAAAFESGKNRTTTMTYMSWNGATEVVQWKLYSVDESGQNRQLVNATFKTGFETPMSYSGFAEHVIVEAIDGHGKSLGESNVFKTVVPVGDASGRWNLDHHAWSEAGDDVKEEGDSWDPENKQESEPHSHTEAEPDSDSWVPSMDEVREVMANPISIFVSGFFACAVVFLVVWLSVRLKRKIAPKAWWRSKDSEYEPVDVKDHDAAFLPEIVIDDEDEDSEYTEEGKHKYEDSV